MRAYYYLLYRIYRFYSVKMNESDIPLIYVSAISTVLIGCNLFTIYSGLYLLGYVSLVSLKVFIITLGVLWLLNHFFFVKGKQFLKYAFDTNIRGSVLIFGYIVLTIMIFILLANKNRERIFSERDNAKMEVKEVYK
jgi:hypothetical protein